MTDACADHEQTAGYLPKPHQRAVCPFVTRLGLSLLLLAGLPCLSPAQLPPEFPAALRRQIPVASPAQAVVFTMNEITRDAYGLDLVRRTGSDVLIRAWFKWRQAQPVSDWRGIADEVHRLGARLGGGITCSALYDGENGITEAQLLDMATRGPDRQLVNAWGQPGIRHGSLSSPAYLDYLFRWCREQIDAGADYLFMDEHAAALQANEGYDDHALADFREYLLTRCPQTNGWTPADGRWTQSLQVELTDARVCPGGDVRSFDYRAYLRLHNWTADPNRARNPLSPLWASFRAWRDDRAWKTLTDRIRAYAAERGRSVWISGNGLVRYADLQVLGVWNHWQVRDGRIDLTESQLPVWRGLVRRGHDLAGKPVPVVLFHDWGFGDPPFPYLAVPPAQRELWMRTRGAEIYAAGAFFAFPVLGPYGCDAGKDGTLATIAKQTVFYQRHRDLFLRGRYVGTKGIASDRPLLSLAAWKTESPKGVALHVINRDTGADGLHLRHAVRITTPLSQLPERATAISPDWDDQTPVACTLDANSLIVTLARLEASAIILLQYPGDVDISRIREVVRVSPATSWARAEQADFIVRTDGSVEHGESLNGFLQGILHTQLRNPPTFRVNARGPATLRVRIQAVANTGAQLNYLIDGKQAQTIELPDLDKKNDPGAPEYARVLTLPIPAGPHRLTLDNHGPDWLTLSWLEFEGSFLPVSDGQ